MHERSETKFPLLYPFLPLSPRLIIKMTSIGRDKITIYHSSIILIHSSTRILYVCRCSDVISFIRSLSVLSIFTTSRVSDLIRCFCCSVFLLSSLHHCWVTHCGIWLNLIFGHKKRDYWDGSRLDDEGDLHREIFECFFLLLQQKQEVWLACWKFDFISSSSLRLCVIFKLRQVSSNLKICIILAFTA